MIANAFADVVGQQDVAQALTRRIAASGGTGSTLLVGPEGVGRFLLAHRAARAILGVSPATAARVDAFHHPDLHVLESGAGINGVRDTLKKLTHQPAEGERPVLIVRDLERFSMEAHNALLKLLEEPPADAAIFLVAHGVELLPETVVSRCRVVRARALTRAETEAVLAGHDAPVALAAEAEGSPGRALLRHELGIAEDCTELETLLKGGSGDPLGKLETLLRKRSSEDGPTRRRRLMEILRVCAARERARLPESGSVLRSVLEALGSLQANGNQPIVFAHLVLTARKGAGLRS